MNVYVIIRNSYCEWFRHVCDSPPHKQPNRRIIYGDSRAALSMYCVIASQCVLCACIEIGRMRFGERKKSVGKRKLKNQCDTRVCMSVRYLSLSPSIYLCFLSLSLFSVYVYSGCVSGLLQSHDRFSSFKGTAPTKCCWRMRIVYPTQNFNSEENLFYITHTIDDSVQSYCWSRILSDVFVSLDREN